MQNMSVLEKMGVQVWRLRGRKASSIKAEVVVNPLEHAKIDYKEENKKNDSQTLANSLGESHVDLGQTADASLDARNELLNSIGTSDVDSQALDAQSIEAQSIEAQEIDAQKIEVQAIERRDLSGQDAQDLQNQVGSSAQVQQDESGQPTEHIPKLNPAPVSPSENIQIKFAAKEKIKPASEIPKLRPAPVPLEPEIAVDLTIDEPVPEGPEGASLSGMGEVHYAEQNVFQEESSDSSLSEAYVDYQEQGQEQRQDQGHSVSEVEPSSFQEKAPQSGGNIDRHSAEGVGETQENSDLSSKLPAVDWRALQATISESEHCPSCGPAQSTLGFGDVLADWMYVADAPTTNDLELQQLFVGRAGQLFENILAACGLTRAQVYSSTVFKCTAPEDISLTPQCDRLIHSQVSLVKPKCIVVFGEFASQAILQSNEPFDRLLKGRHYYPGSNCIVIPSYSPQEVLANPQLKAKLWADLKLAINELV